jgi:CRISPR-associated endonuclease/helicase Cas3
MLLKQHHGLREGEIEGILHIHRRTLNNYLNELERDGKVYKDGLNWFADPEAGRWLRRFELTAAEAFALYLPARMFVKQSDKQNEIVLSALSRLAKVLKTDLPVDDQIFEAVQELRTREKRPSYESHFTDLIHAYLRRNPVTINYRSATGAEFQTTFHTYLVEPSAIGYTLYLIGYSQHVNDLRAYKIERITAVDVDHENNYEIPEEYLTPAFLKNAWSIISGESTERVLLHFNKKIK